MAGLIKWDPFRHLSRFFEEMDKVIADFNGSFFEEVSALRLSDLHVKVEEKDGEVVITADIPEALRENVDVAVHRGHLVIKGEGGSSRQYGDARGFSWSRFTRQQSLPVRIKPEKASVDLKNGKLTIRAPKG